MLHKIKQNITYNYKNGKSIYKPDTISAICVVGETHAHDYFEVITFYNSKDI